MIDLPDSDVAQALWASVPNDFCSWQPLNKLWFNPEHVERLEYVAMFTMHLITKSYVIRIHHNVSFMYISFITLPVVWLLVEQSEPFHR